MYTIYEIRGSYQYEFVKLPEKSARNYFAYLRYGNNIKSALADENNIIIDRNY